MASGMGSGSMMSAASASLVAQVPEMESTILAYASASQLLTSFLGTFTMVFLAAPLQKVIYRLLVRGDKNAKPLRNSYIKYGLIILLSLSLIVFTQLIKQLKNPRVYGRYRDDGSRTNCIMGLLYDRNLYFGKT